MTIAVRVVHKGPGEHPRIFEVENSLPELQQLVGGMLEVVHCPVLGADVYCNEEGRLLALARNVQLPSGHVIVGPLFLADCNSDGELVSMSLERARLLAQALG